MAKVYHLSNDLSRDERLAITHPLAFGRTSLTDEERAAVERQMQIDAVRAAWDAGKYILVAEVVGAPSLEYAYRHTNHVDTCWFEQPGLGVRPEPGNHRSTSIGDIVVNDAEEVAFVACFGFTYITICNEDDELQQAA